MDKIKHCSNCIYRYSTEKCKSEDQTYCDNFESVDNELEDLKKQKGCDDCIYLKADQEIINDLAEKVRAMQEEINELKEN